MVNVQGDSNTTIASHRNADPLDPERSAGLNAKEICRKHGISDATYYTWKSNFGGMSASDLKRLREVEDENAVNAG